jgi:hypothetical protein
MTFIKSPTFIKPPGNGQNIWVQTPGFLATSSGPFQLQLAFSFFSKKNKIIEQ